MHPLWQTECPQKELRYRPFRHTTCCRKSAPTRSVSILSKPSHRQRVFATLPENIELELCSLRDTLKGLYPPSENINCRTSRGCWLQRCFGNSSTTKLRGEELVHLNVCNHPEQVALLVVVRRYTFKSTCNTQKYWPNPKWSAMVALFSQYAPTVKQFT